MVFTGVVQGSPHTALEISDQPLGKQGVGAITVEANAISERCIVVQADDGVGERCHAGTDDLKPPGTTLSWVLRRTVGVKGFGPVKIDRCLCTGDFRLLDAELPD